MTGIELGLVALFAILLVGVLLIADRLGKQLGLAPEMRRKVVHVCLGIAVLTLPFLFNRYPPVVLLCGVSVAILVAARRFRRFGAALHDVGRSSYGEIYFAVSVAVLFILQSEGELAGLNALAVGADPAVFFILPIVIMTLADTAAALAGTEYARRVFPVEKGTKSVEGAVAFLVVTWLSAMIILLLLTDIPRESVIVLSGFLALVGATIEIESWAGLDNLFVPIGLHIILVVLAPANVWFIAGHAVLYALAVAIAFRVANAQNVAQQPYRAAILLLIVFLMSFGPLNTYLVAAALVAVLVANSHTASGDEHADLQAIFAIIVIGIVWLVIGNIRDINMILHFSTTIAAYASLMVILAFPRRLPVALLAFASFSGLLILRIVLAAPPAGVSIPLIATGVGVVVIASAAGYAVPQAFAGRTSVKAAVLSLIAALPASFLDFYA